MKNKKLLKAIAALTLSAAAASCIGMFGCSHTHEFSDEWKTDETNHWHEATCKHTDEKDSFGAHVDGDNNNLCDVCGYRMAEDEVGTQFTVTFHMKDHGTQIEAVKVNENGKINKPTDPTDDKFNFLGWYTDEACETPYNFDAVVTADLDLYALWEHKHDFDTSKWLFDGTKHYHACKVDGCSEVTDVAAHTLENNKCTVCGAVVKEMTYAFEPSRLDAGQYADGITSGIFSIVADGKVRTRERIDKPVLKNDSDEVVVEKFTNTIYDAEGKLLFGGKSVQMDGTKRGFAINAISPGTLTFYAENGSSSVKEDQYQKVVLTKPDGTTEELSYLGKGIRAVTVKLDQVGLYTITRGANNSTSDIYYAKFDTVVPVTAVEKIQIAEKGKVEYIVGQDFDRSRLQVQIVRETTGMIEPLDLSSASVSIDSSAFNKNHGGTYKIVITYTDENNKEFKAEYDVTVYAVEALQLGFNAIIQGTNTSAGNGTYVNHAVKQFYFKGQELDLDGLTVRTVFNGGKQAFIVTEGFTVTGFDKNTAGKQTVKVTWDENPEIFKEFTVYVADYAAASIETTAELVTINVNGALEDANVGTLDNGAYRFKTIQQAIDFLSVLELSENTKKVINLAEGTYKEKLEINIPNLTVKGANSDATKTIIEWDALYGIEDEGGFVHTTDSTATLNVREGAVGFVIEDVTISNWYNSTEHFDEVFGPKYGEHRALAVLIQADKVVMDNVRMLGYQDTLELFTGRQVIKNSYINGRTDFIFGTNNTTYFYNCEIESIESAGYITAFKGCNKGSGDYVTYGAIFDNCNFTCSANVAEGTTAIGRPWGAYAAVAVINSTMGKHISTAGYAGGTSGTRYVSMSGTAPTVETVKFVEYNNSGTGAVTEQVAGMKMLTEAEAANYSDMSVIFGTTNGLVAYSTSWDGGKGVEITEKTYKFSDYYTADDGKTYHEIPAAGEEIFDGLATVTGTKWGHELNQGKDQAKFDAGCVIKFNVAGKVTVTTYGTSYGLPENIQVTYANGKAMITIVATTASPINNGCYITLIKLDTSDLQEHVHLMSEWQVTTVPTAETAGVAAKTCVFCESDPAHSVTQNLPVLSAENYTITASTTSGKATYTFTTDGGDEISFEADELAGQHTHSYGDWTVTATLEAAGTATRVCTSDSCNNDSDKTVVVNLPALTDSRYTVTNNTATLTAAGKGTYSITVDEVEVTFEADTPALTLNEITTNTSISFGSNGNYKTALSDSTLIAEFTASGNIRDNGGNNSQLSGTTLYIKVKAGAKIAVSSYSGYTHYEVNIDGTKYGEEQTGTSWEYTAENDCTIAFVTTNNNNYFYSISVSYGVNTISENKTFNDCSSVESTELIEFSGVTSHNGSFWLFKNGTSASIKLKVAAGATVTLNCSYWGNNNYIVVNDEEKSGLTNNTPLVINMSEGGEVVITILNDETHNQDVYLQSIEVSFGDNNG